MTITCASSPTSIEGSSCGRVAASLLLSALLSLLCGCAEPRSLAVDLRTDFVAHAEFVVVEVELYIDGALAEQGERRVRVEDDFERGQRVAEFDEIPAGNARIVVRLIADDGRLVAERPTSVRFDQGLAITVVISRTCSNGVCSAEDPDAGPSEDRDAGVGPGDRDASRSGDAAADASAIGANDASSLGADAATDGGEGGVSTDAGYGAAVVGAICEGAGDCTAGWGCALVEDGEFPALRCVCEVSVERCDGLDNDCDGSIDDDVDVSSDLSNCGACGNVCPAIANGAPSCVAGSCGAVCAADHDNCNGLLEDGCEASLRTVEDCGRCGLTCNILRGTGSCGSGSCEVASCETGFDDCNGLASDGCERSIRTLDDCGACGATCALPHASERCGFTSGACEVVTCDPGFGDCNGLAADGCEQPLRTLFRDADGDGRGNPAFTIFGCAATVEYVANADDCDDTRPATYVGAPELCNGIDDDCDSTIDDGSAASLGCGGGACCAGLCRDTETDLLNCGACGVECDVMCGAGVCRTVSDFEIDGDQNWLVLSDDTAWTWGRSTATATNITRPTRVTGMPSTNVLRAAGGCVGLRDNRVYCGSMTPVPGLPAETLRDLSAGDGFVCALFERAGGYQSLWCWGRNEQGQLGQGTQSSTTAPRPANAWAAPEPTGSSYVMRVQSLTSGDSHSCVTAEIDPDGPHSGGPTVPRRVYCWGREEEHQLSSADPRTPTWQTAYPAPGAVAAGAYHTCSVTGASAQVICSGDNVQSECGTACGTPVSGLMGVTHLAAGERFACAATSSGVRCWGSNGDGQLGVTEGSSRATPVSVAGMEGRAVTRLLAGSSHTCAVADGAVYCWGDNTRGQLGRGTSGSASSSHLPARVVF